MTAPTGAQPRSQEQEQASMAKIACIMVVLISLGCVNFLLLKEMYTAYGAEYAFFVNQGVNFLYILYGGAILGSRMLLSNDVTPEMRALSKGRFVVMGFLDASGTFLTAMGATFTPGSMQPLLNQTLIPWILMLSRVYLRRIYSRGQLLGAAWILVGACVSALPPMLMQSGGSDVRWYAVCLYALSNVPMAMSSCYKEGNFKEQELDVWYLTQWVSIFQFLLSFAFVPLLCLPGFGSAEGTPLADLPRQFFGGLLCFLQVSEECEDKPTFLLLTGYCAVNIMYSTLGLYLVKVASALMNALSYSILLPCTTLLFFTPLAGVAQEHFSSDSWFTVLGLVLALGGFVIYQTSAPDLENLPAEFARLYTPEDLCKIQKATHQHSIQERIVGANVDGIVVDGEVHWQLVQPLLWPNGDSHVHQYIHQHGDGGSPHLHEVQHRHAHGAVAASHAHDVSQHHRGQQADPPAPADVAMPVHHHH